jgi:hypothetical protein
MKGTDYEGPSETPNTIKKDHKQYMDSWIPSSSYIRSLSELTCFSNGE